jgi:hypothetical protein
MTILRRRSKKEDAGASLVGVVFPTRLATYLTLYSTAHGISKSSVLKRLLTEWVDKKEQTESFDTLIEQTAIRSFNVWNKSVGVKENFTTFKNSLRFELKRKGLTAFADRIINRLNDEKKKNE